MICCILQKIKSVVLYNISSLAVRIDLDELILVCLSVFSTKKQKRSSDARLTALASPKTLALFRLAKFRLAQNAAVLIQLLVQ